MKSLRSGPVMSRISVSCPECRGVFSVKAFRVGHRVACKLCGSVVRVPESGVAVPDYAAEQTLLPETTEVNESPPEPRPVLKRMTFSNAEDAIYDDIFADSDRPSRRRSRGPGITIPRPVLVKIGLGLIAILALYVAYQVGRSGGTPVPTPVMPASTEMSEPPRYSP